MFGDYYLVVICFNTEDLVNYEADVTQEWLFGSKQLQKAVLPYFRFVVIITGMFLY